MVIPAVLPVLPNVSPLTVEASVRFVSGQVSVLVKLVPEG